MNRIFKYNINILILSIILFSSCKGYNQKQLNKETPSKGDIKIAVDEAYTLLADSEIAVFESLNSSTNITPICASEDSVIKLFLADSVRLMISSRKLTENEVLYLKINLIYPTTTHIAWDAVAFLVNKSNPDKRIRYNTIEDIFKGKVNNWKQVNPDSKLGNLKVVFDNQGSSNIRFLMDKFEIDSLPKICFASYSNPAVIDYVEKHPEALGIISVNWVSDPDDSITHNFLSRVSVVAVTPMEFSEGNEFCTPHPAYIAQKTYPFIREVYAISRETFSGVGGNFIHFMSYDNGQRIILKMGMLPATMPIRLIQTRKE